MHWRALVLFAVMTGGTGSAREWRSADSSRTVEAEFGGMKDGKLLLKTKDGNSSVFPASAFSPEDQQFAQQAQVTLDAAVKAGALNFEAGPVLTEGSICRIITELPNQKGTWIAAGLPFLVLRSDELTLERGTKAMGKTLYHAGMRTFQAIDGSTSIISAYSLSLDEAVNEALRIAAASGGDVTKQAPLVQEPLIETIISRGLGLPLGKGFFITDAALLKDAKTVALHHQGKDVPATVVTKDDKLGLALLSCPVEMEQGKFLPRKPLELAQGILAIPLSLTSGGKSFEPPPVRSGIISRIKGTDSFEHDAQIDTQSVGGYVLGSKGDVLGVFFRPQSRAQGKAAASSGSSGSKPDVKGLSECLRTEALEKLALVKDKDGKEKRLPGVPSLRSGTNGDDVETAKEALRKSSVIVVATREESKTPPPPKAAAGGAMPPGAATGWSLSKSGTRHNSTCRYFGSGTACQATDGKPCKVCGG